MKTLSCIAQTVVAAASRICCCFRHHSPIRTCQKPRKRERRCLLTRISTDRRNYCSSERARTATQSEPPGHGTATWRPVSWLVERDVSSARAQLNLSRWDEYSVFQRETLLAAIGAAVRNRQMPPIRFTFVHPEAALSPGDKEQIYRWAHAERRRLRPPVQRSSLIAQNKSYGRLHGRRPWPGVS